MTRGKRRALIVLSFLAAGLAAILAGTPQGRAIIRPTWGFDRGPHLRQAGPTPILTLR